ncbi:MAG TPA: glycine cleavage system aminomethyltransferase GcvT [Aquiluna sp.]
MLSTPLNAEHEKLGASFTDFGGWSMPVRYGSDLDEHHQVRRSAGAFDISHMAEIRIRGPEAAAYLDYALVSKLSELEVSRAKYTLICNEQGRAIDDLIVYRLAEDEFLIVANAANRHAVVVALVERQEAFSDVEILDESDDWALIALQGPKSQTVLEALASKDLSEAKYYSILAAQIEGVEVLLARTGYTGEDGFEIFVPEEHAAKIWRLLVDQPEVEPSGLAARDTLRLEAGMPLYGHELNLEITPFEANLGKVIRFDKGGFIGREALETKSGLAPDIKLYGLKGEGKRAARADYEIFLPSGTEPIGLVTSGALSPTLGYPIAMAFLDGKLELEIGSKLEADVRGTRISFEIVKLPFYKRGR